jgi:hypothetical protein
VIKKLKQVFATHGVPDEFYTDNGPQFQCCEFRQFALEYDFRHNTSSPNFAQANGEAESAVKVAKKLLKQKSLEIALLNYRTTPHSSTGVSPAVALMGRQLKTKLPTLPESLIPQSVSDEDIRRADQSYKQDFKESYDRRHGVVPLSPLKPGDQVLMKTDEDKRWDKQGTVVAADQENRTYLVNSPAGVVRRNRKHLQQLPPPRQIFASPSPEPDSEVIGIEHDVGDPNLQSPSLSPAPSSQRITRAAAGYTAPKPARLREEDVYKCAKHAKPKSVKSEHAKKCGKCRA